MTDGEFDNIDFYNEIVSYFDMTPGVRAKTHVDASKREGEKGARAVLFRSRVARVGCLIWSEKSTWRDLCPLL